MKTRKMISLLALVLALTLPMMSVAEGTYGSAAVTERQTYSVEQMLTYALQDEYLAQAEYTAIIETFGAARPFALILKAEGQHIEKLLALFTAYGLTAPEDTASGQVVLPATLEDAYTAGIAAEENNMAMYDAFLAQTDLPDDVRLVFKALRIASQNHLKAFEANSSRTGIGGMMSGNGNRGGSANWNRNGNRSNGCMYGNNNNGSCSGNCMYDDQYGNRGNGNFGSRNYRSGTCDACDGTGSRNGNGICDGTCGNCIGD